MAVGLTLAASSVLAADFGIGISARSDDGFLYVPIDFSKSFRVEPSVRYASSESTITQSGLDDTQETEILELGIGLFGLRQITEAAHLYYGGRVAYVDTQGTSLSPGPIGGIISSESEQDGYRIGPAIGFEYLFGGHFSVGGEASYTFVDLEGESRSRYGSSFPSTVDIEQKTHGTQTRLIFRYMF
jgi:hypothetical protein